MTAMHRIESPAESGAGTPVHDELCARIAQLDRDFRALSIGELGRRVDAIRKIARTHGLELIEQLKADEALRTIPIMAVTAYAGKGDEDRIRAAGAEAYVSKPISVIRFVEAVEALL